MMFWRVIGIYLGRHLTNYIRMGDIEPINLKTIKNMLHLIQKKLYLIKECNNKEQKFDDKDFFRRN